MNHGNVSPYELFETCKEVSGERFLRAWRALAEQDASNAYAVLAHTQVQNLALLTLTDWLGVRPAGADERTVSFVLSRLATANQGALGLLALAELETIDPEARRHLRGRLPRYTQPSEKEAATMLEHPERDVRTKLIEGLGRRR